MMLTMKFKRAKELKIGDKITLFNGKEVVIIRVNPGWCNRSIMADFKSLDGEDIRPNWFNINKDFLIQLSSGD